MLDSVHILLTYECNFECEHCFLFCGPRAKGTFTLERLRRALDQIAEVESVRSVYFEGGEPFLYFPLLVEGIRLAQERGLDAGVVTNAYWATAEEDAGLWLEPLRETGIANLSLSEDEFHFGDEKDNPARRARAAAERLGLPASTLCVEKPVRGPGDSQAGGSVMIRGRAAETLADDLPRHPGETFKECPHEDLRDPGRVHLDPFGNVHLCQGLLMGTIGDVSLKDLLEAYDPGAHPVAGPLARGGPHELARKTGVPLSQTQFADACHYCYLARRALLPRHPGLLGPPQVYGLEEEAQGDPGHAF
jgi:MoaA/NifB/PqqE/SkfB family radical SAM enzyme